MINQNCLLAIVWVLTTGLLSAQTVPEGINYQALFRSADGSPMANQVIDIEVNLTSGEEVPEIFYQELHQLETDELGLVSVPIGNGKYALGSLAEVPWSIGNIWLSLALLDNGTYREITRNELLSVPYAMHALATSNLSRKGEQALRTGSSIYWLTSGNAKSDPNVHYIGTNDENNLYIKTNNATRYVIDTDGLLTLYGDNSNIRGLDNDKNAYPLVIERGKHGIYIELDLGKSNLLVLVNKFEAYCAAAGDLYCEVLPYLKSGDLSGLESWYNGLPTLVTQDEADIRYIIYQELSSLSDLGTASSNNNFVTFADSEGIQGAIEGQLLEECLEDPFYIIEKTLITVSILKATADLYTETKEAALIPSDGFGSPAAIGAVMNAAANGVNLTAQIAKEIREGVIKRRDIGVSFQSGGADYAEWLPKVAGTRDLWPGAVVGVKNGRISLDTEGAEWMMVVSSKPVLLGNNPPEEAKDQYEKVAFLGQVYVSVLGDVRSGDYLIPSGNNDGYAIAVKPEAMQAGDYHRIIGVAWEDASVREGLSSAINTAVGINANDLSYKIAELELKADQITGYLNGANTLPDESFSANLVDQIAHLNNQPFTKIESKLSTREFNELIDEYAPFLHMVSSQLDELLTESGLNLEDYPVLKAQVDDPVACLQALKQNPAYSSRIAILEMMLLGNN